MQGIVEWVVGVMELIGAPGVGVATALETVFPPIPSEIILPLAGFTAGQGRYSVIAAIAWATVGSYLGAVLLYYVGKAWGLDRTRRFADSIPLASHRDVDRAVEWFGRHGRTAVLVGRMVPGVRSLISLPAGIDRMPMLAFSGYTILGSLAWNLLLIMLGFFLGENWQVVADYVGHFSTVVKVVLGVLAAALVAGLTRRAIRQHRR